MKTRDVTKFLTDMVNIAMFDVDEDGYVIQAGGSTDKRVLINDSGLSNSNGTPILLYQEEIKDASAYILNPLAEGLGQTPSALWFYRALKASLLGRLHTLFLSIINSALQEKKDNKKSPDSNEPHLPMELLNIAARIVDDIDDKTSAEVSQFFSNADAIELLSIYYQKTNLRHIVRSGLFEADPQSEHSFHNKFPKLRKKTWIVLEKLLLGVLHIKTSEELGNFSRKADGITCVRLSSILNTLLVLYQEVNPLLGLIHDGRLAIDLSMFAEHISNLEQYADNARFMISPSRTIPAPVVSVVPGTVSSIPTATSPFVPGTTDVSLVPGAMYTDGRQDPPSQVYRSTTTEAFNAGMPTNTGIPLAFMPGMGPVSGYNPQWNPPSQNYNQLQFGQQPQGYIPPPWGTTFNQPLLNTPPSMNGISLVPGMPANIWRN